MRSLVRSLARCGRATRGCGTLNEQQQRRRRRQRVLRTTEMCEQASEHANATVQLLCARPLRERERAAKRPTQQLPRTWCAQQLASGGACSDLRALSPPNSRSEPIRFGPKQTDSECWLRVAGTRAARLRQIQIANWSAINPERVVGTALKCRQALLLLLFLTLLSFLFYYDNEDYTAHEGEEEKEAGEPADRQERSQAGRPSSVGTVSLALS